MAFYRQKAGHLCMISNESIPNPKCNFYILQPEMFLCHIDSLTQGLCGCLKTNDLGMKTPIKSISLVSVLLKLASVTEYSPEINLHRHG